MLECHATTDNKTFWKVKYTQLSPFLIRRLYWPTPFVTDPGELPDACVVCGDILGDDASYRQLPCSHIFHQPCIDTWLRSQDASCPICRRKFYHLRMPRLVRVASPSASSPTSSPEISHLKLIVSWLGRRIPMRKKNAWFWIWFEHTLLYQGSYQAMINRSSQDTDGWAMCSRWIWKFKLRTSTVCDLLEVHSVML